MKTNFNFQLNNSERVISMPAPGFYSANSTADFSAAARYNKKKFYMLEVKV